MAVNLQAPKSTNWLVWGGALIAAIVLAGALGYSFDWFGAETSGEAGPAIEQTLPTTD